MSSRHIIFSSLMTLFVTISVIVIFLYYINLYETGISIVAIILLIIGLATGALIPGIFTTWLVILLTVVGVAILSLGNVPITASSKLILLVVYPVSAGLMSIDRYVLTEFGWARFNRHDIERYARHYDQVTKFQKLYNAEKMYRKIIHFIQNDSDGMLWCDITAVHWANNAQFRQFHADGYNQILDKIAKVLKEDRLPSESLYYLGQGTFLIISHQLSKEAYAKRNALTQKHLGEIALLGTTPQFKWGSLEVDHSNVNDFLTLEDATNHLQRAMETDLVVEYLKGDNSR